MDENPKIVIIGEYPLVFLSYPRGRSCYNLFEEQVCTAASNEDFRIYVKLVRTRCNHKNRNKFTNNNWNPGVSLMFISECFYKEIF